MLARTRKPHTDEKLMYISCPVDQTSAIRAYLERHGCRVNDEVDASEVFPDRSTGNLLSGARFREDLTQVQLSERTGIPRRHISEMENNKRPIGKANAKKLAEALHIDYRILL